MCLPRVDCASLLNAGKADHSSSTDSARVSARKRLEAEKSRSTGAEDLQSERRSWMRELELVFQISALLGVVACKES
jgi:hypothetical protein